MTVFMEDETITSELYLHRTTHNNENILPRAKIEPDIPRPCGHQDQESSSCSGQNRSRCCISQLRDTRSIAGTAQEQDRPPVLCLVFVEVTGQQVVCHIIRLT